jgi:hypothetical protein
MIPRVLEKQPLKRSSGECPKFVVADVRLAVRKGREVHVGSLEEISKGIVDPRSGCWYSIRLDFRGLASSTKKGGKSIADEDFIITNGKEFWRARHSLGISQFVLNNNTKDILNQAIERFWKEF